MKQQISITGILVFLLMINTGKILYAQENCTFKEPFLNIDFGSGTDVRDLNYFPLPRYERVFTPCPQDGYYSYVAHTSDCFHGDWLTFNEDHTPNDQDGRMLVVNASLKGGIFFNFMIHGLKGNTTYKLGTWLVNVCRISGGCAPLPPDITIKIVSLQVKELAVFHTGLLSQNAFPIWRKYEGIFTTPADVTSVVLTMEDAIPGGCGNDFAMDDITLQECIIPNPVVESESKPPEKTEITKPLPVKSETKKLPASQILKKDTSLIPTKKPTLDKPGNIAQLIKEKPVISIPEPIAKRENPVIKKIETEAGDIIIDLYDNGEIDGDTVTIYHNNQLIVSKAALSEKAISFHINVDESNPHHELVMVADNLGSIPPNTSVMVVTAKNKRYEIFISSSEQKNARVVLDLEK